VAVFPFIKHAIRSLGKAMAVEDLRVSVKKLWKQVMFTVCKETRARVLPNMQVAKADGRCFYDELMTKNKARAVIFFLRF
jgi:hypothetical protein